MQYVGWAKARSAVPTRWNKQNNPRGHARPSARLVLLCHKGSKLLKSLLFLENGLSKNTNDFSYLLHL
jgi:hypothetical protein